MIAFNTALAFPIDEPNDDEVEALLATERRRPDEPPETIAAIRAGATARIAALGLGGGGSEGSSGGGSGAPEGPASPALPALPASSLAPWVIRLAVFAAGATSGWVAHEAVDRASAPERPRSSSSLVERGPKPRVEESTEAAPASSEPRPFRAPPGVPVSPRTASVPRHAPPTSPEPAPSAPEASQAAASPTTGVADLAEEQRLVEAARQALRRGDAPTALATLDEHRQRFANGRLAEEREALAVRALARSGREDAAHARAEAFRRAYPRSLLLPVVDRASPPRPSGETSTPPSPGSPSAPTE